MSIEARLDARMGRRLAAEDRALARLERREARAAALIGEVVRDGKPVYYVMTRAGRVREGTRIDLIAFLLRNFYV
jgi:hypothetical protein